ncbi:MAG: endonuclease [Bacteroidales bacterium]|jgi:hypothetical protein|nr:endonuclease [Bacteroidales bacterium]
MPIKRHFFSLLVFILALLFLLDVSASGQKNITTDEVVIMFYNCENFFDTDDSAEEGDDEFLPGGVRRWNRTRYLKKINNLSKVILAAGEWNPPAIVGLCEVENRKVLDDLISLSPLAGLGYGIIHTDSPDPRGIDVCFIFRKDIVRILQYYPIVPDSLASGAFHTRSVMYARLLILNDTLHLYLNHWPSRRGGVLAGESMREAIADMVRENVESVLEMSSRDDGVIIMGDFNCTPDDPVMDRLVDPGKVEGPFLVNLAREGMINNPGTYRYLGNWELFDQIIISREMLILRPGLSAMPGSFKVFRPDFLLRDDPSYPGKTTFPTYYGYRYQGGFSDHLPVVLRLSLIR